MLPLRILIALVALAAVPAALAQREKLSLQDLRIVEERWPDAQRTATGLRYVMLVEGQGESPKSGDLVAIIYRGSFLDGSVFDEDWDRVRPFAFRLGRNLVIAGMDEGIRLMKPGARATIIVPSPLAYGTRGDPPKIAPNTTLVFEIELIGVQPGVSLETPITPQAGR
jgi:FKBP-type peptidyl-prolyl cis-trans isomerase